MNRGTIRKRVKQALQDQTNKHWTDREINDYIDDSLKEFVRISKHPHVEAYQDIGDSTITGTIVVDGKTATFTIGSGGHGYSTGDAVVVSGASPSGYNGSFEITVPSSSTTTFTYKVKSGSSITDNSVSVFQVGPSYPKPSSISEIISVSIDGRELNFLTESQLNRAAVGSSSQQYFLRSSMGTHPDAFSARQVGTDTIPRWRQQTGPIEAWVANSRTASTFRLYPLPSEDEDIYKDKDATTKSFHSLLIRGVPNQSGLSLDSTEPDINDYWHEAIIFGAMDRAYLKESQLRNVEKSNVFRQKFMELAQQANLSEGMSSASISEGANEPRMVIRRR